ICNPFDDIRLARIVNTPKRGIGEKSFGIAETLAYELGYSVLELMKNAKQFTAISNAAGNAMRDFALLIETLREDAERMRVSELITRIIDVSGYGKMLSEIKDKNERDERLANLDELISAAVQYEESTDAPTLLEFLEEVALVSDIDKYDEEADAVVLMTVHSAKGLEFPVVFLPGMEENIFPSYMTIMNPEEIEEERRLAYVAITRAKKNLYITHVNDRMMNGRTQFNQLSRFAAEIPEELVDREKPKAKTTAFAQTGSSYSQGKSPFASRPVNTQARPYGMGIAPKPAAASIQKFSAGEAVVHPIFGEGVILSVKPMGGDVLYEVVFESAGTKKLMATYAKLKKA
ncbi:MAG: ATP-binding domain-containing protein, partial [Clostridia bacterium]|nr:ATP-binding domain-containing protein [Clostridia bacterium]